jgi:HEAT repeat protein
LPFDALAHVAREDASADRRIQALALLVERSEDGESRAPLAAALSDRDPKVRRKARELMLDWYVESY